MHFQAGRLLHDVLKNSKFQLIINAGSREILDRRQSEFLIRLQVAFNKLIQQNDQKLALF